MGCGVTHIRPTDPILGGTLPYPHHLRWTHPGKQPADILSAPGCVHPLTQTFRALANVTPTPELSVPLLLSLQSSAQVCLPPEAS